jgi:hypothetical protein
MGNVKGSAVTSRVRFVRERFGEAAYRRLRDALPPAESELLDGRILPSGWAPYSLFIAINVEADRLFGQGDLALVFEMARYGAEVNLPTLYRLFYRFNSPRFIFEQAAKLWSVHYDSGRLVALPEDDPGAMRIRIEAFDQPHPAHCLSVLGWAVRSVELSGATVTGYAEERCRNRGDDACELHVRWR